MSLLENQNLTNEEIEKITEISHVFLFLYETYTNKKSISIQFEDSTQVLFDGNRFLFGRFVLQMFSIFSIRVKFAPLKEFQEFPTVADLVLNVFEEIKN